ncbi:MAG: endonuclease/exonuclease/phosphatase family protein [Phenylobacterium sp.]
MLLAAVCAALAVLAQGGRFSATLDVITHFAPLLVAGSVAAATISALGMDRTRRFGLALAAVGLIAAGDLMLPEYLRSTGPTAPPDAPNQIKIIEFNALRGNRNLTGIVDWLQRENPDFVFLTEPTPALRDLIKARTGWKTMGSQSNTIGFARQRYLIMDRPPEPPKTVTFVNATFPSATGPIEAVIAHLRWPTDVAHHAAGDATLRDVLAKRPRSRMVLAGDFNSTPWSFARKRDDGEYGLIRRDRALATWPTGHAGPWPWPAPFPFLPIDHVYAGPGWATVSVKRGPRLGSDHYPIVVTLAPVTPR